MATLDELRAQRDALVQTRRQGVRAVQYDDGKRVEYRSDAELAAAIAEIDREIAAALGTRRRTRFVFQTSKGLDHA